LIDLVVSTGLYVAAAFLDDDANPREDDAWVVYDEPYAESTAIEDDEADEADDRERERSLGRVAELMTLKGAAAAKGDDEDESRMDGEERQEDDDDDDDDDELNKGRGQEARPRARRSRVIATRRRTG
jgi:hypothetical protein